MSVVAVDHAEILQTTAATAAGLVRRNLPNIDRSCTFTMGGTADIPGVGDLTSDLDPVSLCISSRGRLFHPTVYTNTFIASGMPLIPRVRR